MDQCQRNSWGFEDVSIVGTSSLQSSFNEGLQLSSSQTRQGTMRPEAIILFLKQLDFFFCILERKEPIDVQALIAKAAVEGFDERIIRWFSGPREVQRHLVVVGPLVQRLRDELDAVVDLDSFWYHTA